MEGLEPSDDGVKIHCLTTWLHPIFDFENNYNVNFMMSLEVNNKMGKEGVEPPTP